MVSLEQSILQEVHFNSISNNGNRLFIKRDDLLHAEISGNKWRKLKYNLEHAIEMKLDGILTFGGAYSNHLVATAAACQMAGLKSVGIVRGEELNPESNDTLRRCSNYGMQLEFVSRAKYAERHERVFHEELKAQFTGFHLVPEGGANYLGMIGCQEIMKETQNDFDIVVVAQGTTTTSCGILLSIPASTELWVVPVLKGFESINEMKEIFKWSALDMDWIEELLLQVRVLPDHHFGAYAAVNEELIRFMNDFQSETGIELDPVYTAKAMFALNETVQSEKLAEKKILFVHTGGLQGTASILNKQKGKTI